MEQSCEPPISAPPNSATIKPRGHMRSASLENASSFIAKNTLGLPIMQPCFTGTLKSKNEQRRLKSKFGSHNNLEDYVGHRKSKFQHLRNMFETKPDFESMPTLSKQMQLHQQQQASAQQAQAQIQQHKQHQQLLQSQSQQMRVNSVAGIEFTENLNIVETPSRVQPSDSNETNNNKQVKNIVRPIAFKPIPFEADYSIPNRYSEICDRYGSTPSLIPPQGQNMRFGSTQDLRHGYNMYCSNQLQLARRRTRALKINDSMESVRQTPDSDATSQSSTIKSSSKYLPDQFDMTPSPSDSGISDLEAVLKDRDSELSYLRQTMEHNEKAIFKVHKEKEVYWEQEIRRLKAFYENQQREYMLKIKKLEQMLTLQSFQFKQNKLRLTDDTNRLKDQFCELKNENDVLRKETDNLRSADTSLKDRIRQLEDKSGVMDKLIENLKHQLEENEWTVCQKNGEIALLKTQLKEAKEELNIKEHEVVQMKSETLNRKYQEKEMHKINETKKDSDAEISQLNRIVILKDQVILALTSELAKLRKELSDLAIFQEYGTEPNGKYARLKYKIDSLTSICGRPNESDHLYMQPNSGSSIQIANPSKKDIQQQDGDLQIIINCLKTSTPFTDKNEDDSSNDRSDSSSSLEQLKNLPDVTMNRKIDGCEDQQRADTLRSELEAARQTFEREKLQWAEEKEKVLKYQRQLQLHYINMYQKMKDLESKLSVKF